MFSVLLQYLEDPDQRRGGIMQLGAEGVATMERGQRLAH